MFCANCLPLETQVTELRREVLAEKDARIENMRHLVERTRERDELSRKLKEELAQERRFSAETAKKILDAKDHWLNRATAAELQIREVLKITKELLDGCFCNGVNGELPDCARCVAIRKVWALVREKQEVDEDVHTCGGSGSSDCPGC